MGSLSFQFSISIPRMRPRCSTLSVTITILCFKAVAPIDMSKFSILRPAELRKAFSFPYT